VIATRLRASIGFEGLPQLDNQSPFEYQELEFKIDQDTWCVDGFICTQSGIQSMTITKLNKERFSK
jgi:hypothetical protein